MRKPKESKLIGVCGVTGYIQNHTLDGKRVCSITGNTYEYKNLIVVIKKLQQIKKWMEAKK